MEVDVLSVFVFWDSEVSLALVSQLLEKPQSQDLVGVIKEPPYLLIPPTEIIP